MDARMTPTLCPSPVSLCIGLVVSQMANDLEALLLGSIIQPIFKTFAKVEIGE